MTIKFKGKVFYWRGPAPFYFVEIPQKESELIKSVSKIVTYGWGVIPVSVIIGETKISTSLFPKNGKYLVPLKASIRKSEHLELNNEVSIQIELSV